MFNLNIYSKECLICLNSRRCFFKCKLCIYSICGECYERTLYICPYCKNNNKEDDTFMDIEVLYYFIILVLFYVIIIMWMLKLNRV